MSHLELTPYPPMGWNSWDCYGAAVTEEEIRGNAAYMAENLKGIRLGIYRCRYSMV